MSWVLVETVGVAPQRRTYAYKNWRLDKWVAYDERGVTHPFAPGYVIRLGAMRKEFWKLEDLNEFLKAKGLPTFQQQYPPSIFLLLYFST